ncbi:terminus macrodomain insulation protein YfbV [Alteromonas sp. D210916BOD_24]|uniref:terminus macrodomain insulation protein YfbV n=1 Tax=Alteromonas sp. D210916BOD_24 TaxID=3157618 RepID=UPI00399C6C6D
MSQSVMTMLKDGQKYMKTWPVRKELYAYFPECRVVAATKFAIKTMPPVAIICCALLLQNLGTQYLPQTIAIGAFFISLPMQGLLWLGHRSEQHLPPQLKSWYQEIHSKMRTQGCDLASLKSQPKYKELAKLLKTAFNDLDNVFTKQWFN